MQARQAARVNAIEGAASLLAAAIIVPLLLGGAGLVVLRQNRRLGIALVCGMVALIVLMAVFALG